MFIMNMDHIYLRLGEMRLGIGDLDRGLFLGELLLLRGGRSIELKERYKQ